MLPVPLCGRTSRGIAAFAVSSLLLLPAASAQAPALMRYNTVVESTYLLERCGALTPARREHLRKLKELAMQPLDWPAEKWTAHDAGLNSELQRLYPRVPKERCDELVLGLEQEMKR